MAYVKGSYNIMKQVQCPLQGHGINLDNVPSRFLSFIGQGLLSMILTLQYFISFRINEKYRPDLGIYNISES